VLVGGLAVFAASSLHTATAALFVLAPIAALVVAAAVPQAVRNLATIVTSFSLWQGLLLLLFVSGLVFRIRSATAIQETPVDAYAGIRIVLVAATACTLLACLVLRKPDWSKSLFRGLVGALTAYALVSAISALWSVFPAWTLYKSLEYLVDVALFAAILATVRSAQTYRALYNWIWVMYGALLLTVWVGAVVVPGEAWLPTDNLLRVRLSGVFPALDQNSVGEFAAYLAIVALVRLLFSTGRGGAFHRAVFAFGLITLVFSQTRVAIVGFLLAALLILFFSKRRGLLAILVLGVGLLLLTSNAAAPLWALWQRGESLEALQGFSGRLTMWEFGWDRFLERPLTGYGAYAGGRFAVVAEVANPNTSSVLSSYIEVLVGTGLWGLVPMLFALAGTWWFLIRSLSRFPDSALERQLAVEAVGLLAIITARSFFTTLLIWHPALPFLATLGYVELLRRRQRRGRGVSRNRKDPPNDGGSLCPG
jgi:O-antigen ligase